jgi:hypothetical protein
MEGFLCTLNKEKRSRFLERLWNNNIMNWLEKIFILYRLDRDELPFYFIPPKEKRNQSRDDT